MSYARSPREVCSTTTGTRLRPCGACWFDIDFSRAGGASRTGTHDFIETQGLLDQLSVFCDPFDNLVFHHATLQALHQLGIARVKFNDLLGFLVRRCDRRERLGDAARIEAHLVLASE